MSSVANTNTASFDAEVYQSLPCLKYKILGVKVSSYLTPWKQSLICMFPSSSSSTERKIKYLLKNKS